MSLTCSAQGTNVTYFWSLQGAPLPKDPQYHLTENNRVLTINPVSDNGTFTCTAANLLNSQTSNGVVFNLALPPEGHMACLQGSSNQYIQLSCSWQGGEPAANVTMVFNGLSETGTNQVTRNVPVNTSLEGLTMMCYGDYFGKPSNCEQKFVSFKYTGMADCGLPVR